MEFCLFAHFKYVENYYAARCSISFISVLLVWLKSLAMEHDLSQSEWFRLRQLHAMTVGKLIGHLNIATLAVLSKLDKQFCFCFFLFIIVTTHQLQFLATRMPFYIARATYSRYWFQLPNSSTNYNISTYLQ